jgi:hypothetical protein
VRDNVPTTALNHFNQDIARARAIVAHADPLPQAPAARDLLRSDLLRSAWMFGVGALDAYFCDAYTDAVAATVISKSRQPGIVLPDWFGEIRFPVRAILEPYPVNLNWRWRMAAREMMERENVLSLSAVQTLFNKFFRDGQRFFGDLLDAWIMRPDSNPRLFGILRLAYSALDAAGKEIARRAARRQLSDRFALIFQRRHDCIHNCDRPRVAPQQLKLASTVHAVIEDVEYLVHRCDEHINVEFREFLSALGCTGATIARAGY